MVLNIFHFSIRVFSRRFWPDNPNFEILGLFFADSRGSSRISGAFFFKSIKQSSWKPAEIQKFQQEIWVMLVTTWPFQQRHPPENPSPTLVLYKSQKIAQTWLWRHYQSANFLSKIFELADRSWRHSQLGLVFELARKVWIRELGTIIISTDVKQLMITCVRPLNCWWYNTCSD